MGITTFSGNEINPILLSLSVSVARAPDTEGGGNQSLQSKAKALAQGFFLKSEEETARIRMCGQAAINYFPDDHSSNTVTYDLPDKAPQMEQAVSEGTAQNGHAGVQSARYLLQENSREKELLALYDEYRPRLYRYMRSMQLGPEQAEEIVQETFMRLTVEYRKEGELENVRGWIVRVAHNLAVNLLKRERSPVAGAESQVFVMENLVDPASSPEETYSKQERSKLVYTALSSFKLQHRQCFQMRAQGLRYKDIGLAMGISEQRAAYLVKQVAVKLAAACGCDHVR